MVYCYWEDPKRYITCPDCNYFFDETYMRDFVDTSLREQSLILECPSCHREIEIMIETKTTYRRKYEH